MDILLIISLLLLASYCGLLGYYALGWKSLQVFHPQKATTETQLPILSVIIPARNEAGSISLLLESLQNQSYPSSCFEVIVVDDFSSDNTLEIAQAYPFVKAVALKDFLPETINSYKKKAIEVGIQQSRGELIVTTDADCIAPKNWLKTIAAYYETYKPSLIVMPVAIDASNRAIEVFQSLDFMSLQGITAASVSKNVHSMCNGANLAYTRKAFEAVGGFEGIDSIASGDDMLLMHKIAELFPRGIRYLQSKEVIIHTAPVQSVKAFLNQRIRWASKADKYDDKRIFAVLLMVYALNVALLVFPLVLLVRSDFGMFKYWFGMLALKTIVEMAFLFPVARFFGKEGLLWYFPLAQPFHIVYTVLAGFLGKFGKYSWKGRQVK
ncbi:MAG: glycosyltransferase [Chitinophagaceae bacterium]|nr:MAG: glycosyltransferase [Chitinophagaceae bacterium]